MTRSRRLPVVAFLPLLALAIVAGLAARPVEDEGPKLAHMVFFTLKDHSKAARERFVASCHKYLSGHDGVEHYSIGVIAEDVEEPVSVRDFDVALHLVFEDKDAEAAYIVSARHKQFIEANKDAWAKVRVFDSYIAPRD